MNPNFTNRLPIDDELRAAVAYTDKLNRGDLLRYDTLAEITGLRRNSAAWAKLTRQLRKSILGTRGIHLRAEPGVGYWLLSEDEQVEVAVRAERNSTRSLKRAVAIASLVDPAKLSPAMRAQQSHFVTSASRILSLMAADRAERKQLTLTRKTETIPR